MTLGGTNTDESLFKVERDILKAALADIANNDFYDNKLLPQYKLLVNQYQKLLKTTIKTFHISDSQGQVLQRHQNEIQNLLDNADQGFLTFGRDLKVDRQYSAECTRIFGKKIAGLSITELLELDYMMPEYELRDIFTSVFSCKKGNEHSKLAQIPTIFKINEKDIRVKCKLISQTEEAREETLVMMILTDITERLKAEEQIRFLSYHDKLTSLYNRAHVEAILPDLEKPEALPMSIIMADMNGLKLVNDVFGHQQGDLLLVSMANVLRRSCPPNSIVVRWGGDEFLIILPQTNKEACSRVCDEIRKACNEESGPAVPLSAAIGTATKESGVARLTEMFNIAENRMYSDKLDKGKEVRKSMIAGLEMLLLTRCFENDGHSERVKQIVTDFVTYLGWGENSAEIGPLMQLARLHDIGKVAIPREILGKPGALTSSEWDVLKGHSEIGYRMAQSIGESAVADIILALHERWDGSGYPHGLKGEQIPVLARIFSLADAYDIITHDRPYKGALGKAAAMSEIESGLGSQFDPKMGKRFLEYLRTRSKSKRGAGLR